MVTPTPFAFMAFSRHTVLAAVSMKHLPRVSEGLYSMKSGISGR